MITEKQQVKLHELLEEFEVDRKNDLITSLILLFHDTEHTSQVKNFMDDFNQEVSSVPALPSKEVALLRLNLILEETIELAEACGKEVASQFSVRMHDKAQKLHVDTEKRTDEKGNIVEAFDALIDLPYVVNGAILAFGFQDKFNEGFEEVHESNMSKGCSSPEEAINTKASYEAKGEECFIEQTNETVWLVKRTEDKKLLKSVLYNPANLTDILFPVE